MFADTLYMVAIANPHDHWHAAARAATAGVADLELCTTEEVLIEFLTALASGGAHLRARAVTVVRAVLEDPTTTVSPQSHRSFLAGMELYENRPDKSYSMVDCISMNAMREEDILDILTNDHHFTQEGFNIRIHR